MSSWQPIETAPRTSRSILVWVPDNQCTYCVSWRESDDPEVKSGWVIFGGDWREFPQMATHWMPVPVGPIDSADQGRAA